MNEQTAITENKVIPKISVIMPAYNAVNTIGTSIQSILAQTFSDFELVVVNDGSTDNTEEVVKLQNDSRIKLFRKENGGVVSAYKQGIGKATGKYVMFCDSEDTYNPDFLNRAFSDIEKYDCDFCSYPYRIIQSSRKHIDEFKNVLPHGFYGEADFKKKLYPHLVFNSFVRSEKYIIPVFRWNKIYKKTLLDKMLPGIDINCYQLEDNVFTVLMLLNASSCYIDNDFFCYNYITQSNSISQSYKGIETFESYMYAVKKIKNILEMYGYNGSYKQLSFFAYDNSRVAFRRCAKHCDFSECKKLIKEIKNNELISQVKFSEIKMLHAKIYHILLKLHFYRLAYFIFGLI